MRLVALCFPVRGEHVLLARRTDGRYKDRWTGYGGGVEKGESVKKALVRELREEGYIAIAEEDLWHSAEVVVRLDEKPAYKLHVYTTWRWHGEPKDSAEMRDATWFAFGRLPLDHMIPGDGYWLPHVLAGNRLVADVRLFSRAPRRVDVSFRHMKRYHPYKGPAE